MLVCTFAVWGRNSEALLIPDVVVVGEDAPLAITPFALSFPIDVAVYDERRLREPVLSEEIVLPLSFVPFRDPNKDPSPGFGPPRQGDPSHSLVWPSIAVGDDDGSERGFLEREQVEPRTGFLGWLDFSPAETVDARFVVDRSQGGWFTIADLLASVTDGWLGTQSGSAGALLKLEADRSRFPLPSTSVQASMDFAVALECGFALDSMSAVYSGGVQHRVAATYGNVRFTELGTALALRYPTSEGVAAAVWEQVTVEYSSNLLRPTLTLAASAFRPSGAQPLGFMARIDAAIAVSSLAAGFSVLYDMQALKLRPEARFTLPLQEDMALWAKVESFLAYPDRLSEHLLAAELVGAGLKPHHGFRMLGGLSYEGAQSNALNLQIGYVGAQMYARRSRELRFAWHELLLLGLDLRWRLFQRFRLLLSAQPHIDLAQQGSEVRSMLSNAYSMQIQMDIAETLQEAIIELEWFEYALLGIGLHTPAEFNPGGRAVVKTVWRVGAHARFDVGLEISCYEDLTMRDLLILLQFEMKGFLE